MRVVPPEVMQMISSLFGKQGAEVSPQLVVRYLDVIAVVNTRQSCRDSGVATSSFPTPCHVVHILGPVNPVMYPPIVWSLDSSRVTCHSISLARHQRREKYRSDVAKATGFRSKHCPLQLHFIPSILVHSVSFFPPMTSSIRLQSPKFSTFVECPSRSPISCIYCCVFVKICAEAVPVTVR